MYALGLIALSLGCALLIPGLFALGLAFTPSATWGERLMMLLVALFPVGSMAGGIALIRRAEEKNPRKKKSRDRPAEETLPVNSIARIQQEMGTFDLSRLNWIGWLLGVSSVLLMVILGAAIFVATGQNPSAENRPARAWGYLFLAVAVGFFLGVKQVLKWSGVSIFRDEGRPQKRRRRKVRMQQVDDEPAR